MIHLTCSCLGILIIYYELTNISFRIFFQYSGWFLFFTTFLHILQIIFLLPSFLAYVCSVIGIVIILPASVPSLMSLNNTFASYLLYDFGAHVALPLCTVFHLNNTSYTNISSSIIFLIAYNTIWAVVVELLSVTKPYDILNDLVLEHRLLSYIIVTIIGITGLMILSILPCISSQKNIRI